MESGPLRIGIIGTGSIADAAHAPALNNLPEASLWSVLSRDIIKASEFCKKHNAQSPTPAHDTLDSFLSDPMLQAVIITSPDKLHAAHIIACADAGKHVLVEKPMVTNHEDGLKAITVCKKNNVRLAVAFHLRWHAGHRKLHSLVTNDNAIGAIRHIRAHWSFKAPDNKNWRATPDLGKWWSLAAVGVHCIDLSCWFAESPDRKIISHQSLLSSETWNTPHDEKSIILFKYSDGLTVESTTSVLFNSPSRFEVYGDDGFAVCEGTLSRFGAGKVWINEDRLDFMPVSPFEGEIRDFVLSIRDNRPPEVTGESGLATIDKIIAATT